MTDYNPDQTWKIARYEQLLQETWLASDTAPVKSRGFFFGTIWLTAAPPPFSPAPLAISDFFSSFA
jgi:hypothetical protein